MKLVITRKDHLCEKCGKTIPKGSEAFYVSTRFPEYDDNGEEQVGIFYYSGWSHTHDCTIPKECKENGHDLYKVIDPSDSAYERCKVCGREGHEIKNNS